MRRLTLYVPGLEGPAVELTDADMPDAPALRQILFRARRRRLSRQDYYRQLAGLLGLETAADKDVPVAAVTRLIDGEDHPGGLWMRADPAHLSADRDRLLLIDASVLTLSQHDALAVATEAQQVLDMEGWRMEVPFPNRWYIQLQEDPEVSTSDPYHAGGRDVDSHLPAGPGGRRLHRLLNEIQMQLFDADINREREARGDLTVNSLWFWGVGKLPDVLPRHWSEVYSDDPFAHGLAMLSMTPCRPLPGSATDLLDAAAQEADILVTLEACRVAAQYADLQRWHQAVADLEQYWFAPLLDALHGDAVQEISVVTSGLVFRLRRVDLKKFWRRPRPLRQLLEAGAA